MGPLFLFKCSCLEKTLPTLVLSGFVFLSQAVLFLSAAIFVYSGYRTAQQAEVNSESCMIKFYYGRKRIFKLSQVEDINTFNLKIKFPLYFTPLNQLGLNYRINLMGGKVIYVSGLMPNVDELIRQIKTQRSGHPKVG